MQHYFQTVSDLGDIIIIIIIIIISISIFVKCHKDVTSEVLAAVGCVC